MKKALSLILALILCVSLCNCGSKKENKAEETTTLDEFEDHDDFKEDEEIMYTTYASTIKMLKENEWYYSGANNCINKITFSDREANIVSYYAWVGTTKPSPTSDTVTFAIDDNNITVALDDSLVIPYTVEGDNVKLDESTYFTPDMVIEGLQGYWHHRETSYRSTLQYYGTDEYNVYIEGNKLVYENACTAYGKPEGTYYYYGPYSYEFNIVDGGFELNETNAANFNFGFNIINGTVVFTRSTDIFQPFNGPLPGRENYSF